MHHGDEWWIAYHYLNKSPPHLLVWLTPHNQRFCHQSVRASLKEQGHVHNLQNRQNKKDTLDELSILRGILWVVCSTYISQRRTSHHKGFEPQPTYKDLTKYFESKWQVSCLV